VSRAQVLRDFTSARHWNDATRSMISASPGSDLKTPVPIGENFYGRRALYTALQMKACDYAMPDFMRIGVTGWQRAAAIAAAAGIPISTHLYRNGALARVQDWANPILQQPYEVKAGKLHRPDVAIARSRRSSAVIDGGQAARLCRSGR
jgi:hypothetical protein